MLGATVANIAITIVIFMVILILYAQFLAPLLPETVQAWGLPITFVLAIVLSFIVYRACVKILFKKIDVEKYFDPLFIRKRK
jgi:hypothetical protein